MFDWILVGVLCVGFGGIHVVWPRQVYDFYQRHAMLRFFSGSTMGAMRVHGAILAVLGAVLVLRAILA